MAPPMRAITSNNFDASIPMVWSVGRRMPLLPGKCVATSSGVVAAAASSWAMAARRCRGEAARRALRAVQAREGRSALLSRKASAYLEPPPSQRSRAEGCVLEAAWMIVYIISDRLSARAAGAQCCICNWSIDGRRGRRGIGPGTAASPRDGLYPVVLQLFVRRRRGRRLLRASQQPHGMRGRDATEEPGDRRDEVQRVDVAREALQ
mmetsp:Transcript_7596/g.20014  ORF Transcript_7596/g.20014 Transcript_7596/m.20014 type:complete len:207 (-) Transcript_7596:2430-3050(-)